MTRVDEYKTDDSTERVALSYFLFIMQRDLEGLEKIWHDDAVQELPFTPEGLGDFAVNSFRGKVMIMDHYRAAVADRREHVFWIDNVYQTNRPGCVIIEAHARSIVGETQRVYENSYVCIFQIDGGKVVHLREYLDPAAVVKAFSGAFG